MPYNLSQSQYQAIFAHIDICNSLFPKAFPRRGQRRVMPLKIGVADDLQVALAEAGHEVSKKAISRLLTYWCSRNFYLKAFRHNNMRIDLAGEPAGEITDKQRLIAKENLSRRASRREAKAEARLKASEQISQQAI